MFTNMNCQIKRGRKKTRRDGDRCLVCGGQSIGLNFGVHSCSPCKAFFRRNAVKLGTYEFVCGKDGDCPVSSDTRRQCNCCRLAKCFRVGMDRNAIRTEEQKLERNQLVEYNRQRRVENIEIIQPVNLLKHSHKTYSSLSSNDQTLLSNIFSAYEQTCVALRYHQQYEMPNDDTLSLQKFMNSCSHMYMALVDYFKFVPEFTQLSINTRISLLKNNLNQIFRLNSALIIQATGIVENKNALAFMHVFPPDLFLEQCQCAIALFPFVHDPIFLKLLLIVLIFSTSLITRYNENEQIIYTKNLISSQDFYIELLWRYILYRSSSYQQSVQVLTSFITRLLHSQLVSAKLSEYISKETSNAGDQLVPMMKAMWSEEKNE